RVEQRLLRLAAGQGGAFTIDATPVDAGQGLPAWDLNVTWLTGIPIIEDQRRCCAPSHCLSSGSTRCRCRRSLGRALPVTPTRPRCFVAGCWTMVLSVFRGQRVS